MTIFSSIWHEYEELPLLQHPTRRRCPDVEPMIPVPSIQVREFDRLTLHDIRTEGLAGQAFIVRGVGGVFPPELESVLDIIRSFPPRRSCTVFDCNSWKHRSLEFRDLEEHFSAPREERDGPLTVFDIELKGGAAEPPHKLPGFLAELFDSPAKIAQKSNGRHKVPHKEFLSHLLLSSDGAVTDFHVDFGGGHGAIYMHSGEKTVFIAPHDRDTRALYERWLRDRDEGTWYWFPNVTNPPIRLKKCTLQPGDLLIMPGGTPHAVFTNADSAILTTNWLSFENAQTQMECIEQEERTDVPGRLRFRGAESFHLDLVRRLLDPGQTPPHLHLTALPQLVRFLIRRGLGSDALRVRENMRRRGISEATTSHPVLVTKRVGRKRMSYVVGREERTLCPKTVGSDDQVKIETTALPAGWMEVTRLVMDQGYTHLGALVHGEGIEAENIVDDVEKIGDML
ncbi:hypothetical protein M427DRAFT_50477 [Gonapodya prolifera JEL478]|uniref:[histone H3]-dimethyl-L-lysine(36) demethylase n=1 Tax=Gonapodya prolifera (strain JEL478) TaxID=1344416 RepID=A0A139AZH4_GONPJ|nr:hypothetical protein M427DRAFT_50477 [Gonapodya prolifera JEL478]|eukprot:KXS22114.1 hypothetical protein M427DRAFT_50477 [Gonapodya prolifera JEL478]